jgi:hypothetical protein
VNKPTTIGPINTDQDVVNAILALSLAIHVESWRTKWEIEHGELPLTVVVANAIADLQRCAHHIRRVQSGEESHE